MESPLFIQFVTDKSDQTEPPSSGSVIVDKSGQKRATKTLEYDFFGRHWARKSHQDPGLRLLTDKSGSEKTPRPRSTICCG